MTFPTLSTLTDYLVFLCAGSGALLTALWVSLVIWSFRDMRARSRDPFAQIFAALVVALLPGVGLLIYVILRPPETLAEAYERALEEEALLQEIEERPKCPGCSRLVDGHWVLCAYCHTRLKKKCRDCGELQELQWNLCPFCGNHHVDLYHVEPPRYELEGERDFALDEPIVRSEPYELASDTATDADFAPTEVDYATSEAADFAVDVADAPLTPPGSTPEDETTDLPSTVLDRENEL